MTEDMSLTLLMVVVRILLFQEGFKYLVLKIMPIKHSFLKVHKLMQQQSKLMTQLDGK